MKIYRDEDADTASLSGKIIGIIGYGNQGSAQARCLRDSGVSVVVGVREGGLSFKRADNDRMTVMSIREAAEKSDIVCMLVPDMVQREVYERHVAKALSPGKALYFSHGFSITYGLIRPPRNIDVFMLAPKATGSRLREAYLHEEGVPALLAVHQDSTGEARRLALAMAKAMRFTRKGVFECTFAQETHANLFAEQAVTIGGLASLVKAGFETMLERGIPPELAYFECVSVTRLMAEMLEREGLRRTLEGVSRTAGYGAVTRGERVVGQKARKEMMEIFDEIRSGAFTREWLAEYESGMRRFESLKKAEGEHPLEKVGARLRKLLIEE